MPCKTRPAHRLITSTRCTKAGNGYPTKTGNGYPTWTANGYSTKPGNGSPVHKRDAGYPLLGAPVAIPVATGHQQRVNHRVADPRISPGDRGCPAKY
jgi:hypothetical protein